MPIRPNRSRLVLGAGVLTTTLFAAASLPAWMAQAADRVTGKPFATRSEIHAPKVMAATSHPLATQIALQTMRDGGSAVDAAIAANAALGLMEPAGCGLSTAEWLVKVSAIRRDFRRSYTSRRDLRRSHKHLKSQASQAKRHRNHDL